MLTARLGGMVVYPLRTVTVPLHVPLQEAPDVIQCAVRVTVWKDGPQDANVDGLAVRVTLPVQSGLPAAAETATGALTCTGTAGDEVFEQLALSVAVTVIL